MFFKLSFMKSDLCKSEREVDKIPIFIYRHLDTHTNTITTKTYIQKAGDPGDKTPPFFLDFRQIFG